MTTKAIGTKGLLGVACAMVALILAPPALATPRHAGSTSVEPWIELELQAIVANRSNPPRASRALALLSVAMDRAAAATPGSKPAIDAAATTVLDYLYPNLGLKTKSAPDNGGKHGGYALGRRIGQEVVARAASDGSDSLWTGSVPIVPGCWVPTPPGFVSSPLEPTAPSWRPWNISSGSQFRPGPPPAFGSAQWLSEVQQVYEVSQQLTPEQKAIALYWADGAGSVTPPGHWNKIALEFIREHALTTPQAAHVLAALNTAQADAFIAGWDTKYTYWTMRPVTAIRMLIDPSWSPVITTPPFPSYVSGHATTSAAASTVLEHFFPAEAERFRARWLQKRRCRACTPASTSPSTTAWVSSSDGPSVRQQSPPTGKSLPSRSSRQPPASRRPRPAPGRARRRSPGRRGCRQS